MNRSTADGYDKQLVRGNSSVRDAFHEHCRSKLEHGVPGLTIEDQRLLLETATGWLLDEPRKRCPDCGATGWQEAGDWHGMNIRIIRCKVKCSSCDGTGYTRGSG